MMFSRVFLHVGMTKSGSTAIQNFLDRNYDNLINQGILFPRSVLTRKDPTDPSRTSGHLELIKLLRRGNVGRFLKECSGFSGQIHTLVLSSESIFHQVCEKDLECLRPLLWGAGEVTLIALLRIQSDWILARHYEHVVKGFFRETRPIDCFVVDTLEARDLDYLRKLEVILDVLRPARVQIWDYDEVARDGDLIGRFAEEIGFRGYETSEFDSDYVNRSEPFPEAMEAHRLLNSVALPLGTAEYRSWCSEMRRHYRDLASQGVLKKGYILPGRPIRRKIYDAVMASNSELSKRYFPKKGFVVDISWAKRQDTILDNGLVNAICRFGGGMIAKHRSASS